MVVLLMQRIKENVIDINAFTMDDDYIECYSNNYFSNFTKEIIIYTSRFVVYKLTLYNVIYVKILYVHLKETVF